MREIAFRLLTFALLATIVPGHASAADESRSPEAFIRQLYSRYDGGQKTPEPTRADAANVFDASTLKLIRCDQRNAAGEVGVLDYDPICDCQDYEIASVVVSTNSISRSRANVTARFQNFAKDNVVEFDLVRRHDAWRIHDIHTARTPSLRELLDPRKTR